MTVGLTKTAMIALHAGLDHARAGVIVAKDEELAKAGVRAPRGVRPGVLRVARARRNAPGLTPTHVAGDRITHERSQLIVCHSCTST
jgi:hypothetical protein